MFYDKHLTKLTPEYSLKLNFMIRKKKKNQIDLSSGKPNTVFRLEEENFIKESILFSEI